MLTLSGCCPAAMTGWATQKGEQACDSDKMFRLRRRRPLPQNAVTFTVSRAPALLRITVAWCEGEVSYPLECTDKVPYIPYI